MRLHSALDSIWFRAALIAPMALAVLTAGKCGGGGGNKSSSSGGTYSCRCDCDMKTQGAPSSVPFHYPIRHGEAFTCADSNGTALAKCPQACVIKAKEDHRNTTSTVQQCKATDAQLEDANRCVNKQTAGLISAKPKTASFEGPLDFGRSELNLKIPQSGDKANVKLKGSLVMVGGNCPHTTCPVQLWFVDLAPHGDSFSTNKGMQFSSLKAINEGVWTGVKYADGTLQLGSQSQLTISTYRDGVHDVRVLYPSSHVSGRIEHSQKRVTHSGVQSGSNALIVDGTFSGDEVEVDLHLHAWLTDCRPKVSAKASCYGGPDGNSRYLRLQGDAELLGSLIGADLCQAIKYEDPEDVCAAGGTVEFPRFTCLDPGVSNLTPEQTAQRLSYEWSDANGKELGTTPTLYLKTYVSFPVTLTVRNEFGREARAKISYAPTGHACPMPRVRLPDPIYSPWPIHKTPGFGGWLFER